MVAGTGNGMAKSLLDAVGETYSISNAVFSVIRGYILFHCLVTKLSIH